MKWVDNFMVALDNMFTWMGDVMMGTRPPDAPVPPPKAIKVEPRRCKWCGRPAELQGRNRSCDGCGAPSSTNHAPYVIVHGVEIEQSYGEVMPRKVTYYDGPEGFNAQAFDNNMNIGAIW